MDERRWIVAVTGASGAVYGLRLLEMLVRSGLPADVIVSEHGWRLLRHETEVDGLEALRARIGSPEEDTSSVLRFFDNTDRGARPASGSAPYRGMVICPCSMATLASIAHGISRSLTERAADVTLKERRPLVLVPRETPLSAVHLEAMAALARLGVVVLPAAPGFYHRPRSVADLVDFIVGRVLDHMGVEHSIGYRWTGEEEEA